MKTMYYYEFNVWYYDNNNQFCYNTYRCATLKRAKEIKIKFDKTKKFCKSLGYKFEKTSDIFKLPFD